MKHILPTLLLALLGTCASAQTLIDPYRHQTLELQSIRRAQPADRDDEHYWLSVQNTQDKRLAAIDTVTEKLVRQYATDPLRFKVLKDFEARCSTKNAIELLLNEGRGMSHFSEDEPPTLYGIDCAGLGLIQDHLFFQVSVELYPKGRAAGEVYDMVRMDYLHVMNLKKGVAQRVAPLPQKEADALRAAILPKVQAVYDSLDTVPPSSFAPIGVIPAMDPDEYAGEDGEYGRLQSIWHSYRDSIPRPLEDGKVGPALKMEEAMISWQGIGLRVAFADFSESSRIFYGRGFAVTLPLQQAASILGHLPDWAFLKAVRPTPTKARNLDLDDLITRVTLHLRVGQHEHLPMINRVKKCPASLEVRVSGTTDQGLPSNVDTLRYRFHHSGKLAFSTRTGQGQPTQYLGRWTYDDAGRTIRTEGFGTLDTLKPKVYSELGYETDPWGNVTLKKGRLEETAFEEHFLYNGIHAYKVRDGFFATRLDEEVQPMQVADPLCLYGYCFDMGPDGFPRNMRSTMGEFQVRCDAEGRVLEFIMDRDRYQRYYTYDDAGRIARYEYHEWGKLKESQVWEYEGAQPLPSSMVKTEHQNEPEIKTTHLYHWKF